jgi:hypothetical protein
VSAPPALPSLIGLLEFLALPTALLAVIFTWGWWQTTRQAAKARATRPAPNNPEEPQP